MIDEIVAPNPPPRNQNAPAPQQQANRSFPMNEASQPPAEPSGHTIRPILQNRQARRVAEIDPVGKTVIAIYNRREDVKTRYNMCLKTLKKKIENEEVFLDRRWIEPDYIPDDHVYHDIIRAFEQQT